MSVIQETVDPITNRKIIVAKGEVEGVYFNELKNVRTYQNGWTPTHAINILVGGVRLGAGLTEKEETNCKDVDGNYHTLAKGMQISAVVEEADVYKGQQQYRTKPSLITILDASGAQESSPKGSQGSSGTIKRDNSGMIAGNAFNAAKIFLQGLPSEEEVISTAKEILVVGNSLREWLKEQDSSLDDYTVGARVGMAILAAAEVSETLEDVEETSKWALTEILPDIIAEAKKLEGSYSEAPKKAPKAAKKAAKRTARKAPAKEEAPEVGVDGLESDIPF